MHFYRCKSTLDSLKSFFNAFKRKQLLGAPDFTPPVPSLSIRAPFYRFLNLLNATQKSHKRHYPKKDFHTWELNSKPPTQKSLLHWKQNKHFLWSCRGRTASWFILTGSTAPFEISTTLTIWSFFFGKLRSVVCDFSTFISTAICESSRSPFSRLQEKYWIKFQEFESWLSSKGQRISSKTSPKPERVVRIKINLSFVNIMNVISVTSDDNWVRASS